ncbi:inhibitor of growth protein 4-like isoform X1 [Rhopalosiphum padi]|uniref:inhibitor of growth protein 4-like isoform X1 n=1 Tax=Rhopalosiphum padi TaxID=40932 RepID=UPI00298EB8DC|nr:inhibitor of growth protein 4-like isoform X1 [Rhopalosiphum padi]
MSSSLNLEHYLDSLKNLPVELQRNFTLKRDLDSRVQELMRTIDKLSDDYISNVKEYTADKKREILTIIRGLFDIAKGYAEDKVQLSIQSYELVDKHVRKFDSGLARFGDEIQDKAISATRNIEENSQKRRCSALCHIIIPMYLAISLCVLLPEGHEKINDNPTNSVTSVTVETSSLTGALVGAGIAHSAEVLDMPVDPNEPTYCLCKQVPYGEMIGCDNPDCPLLNGSTLHVSN